MANETILIVDDSLEMVRFLEESVLGPLGYRLIKASDGRIGLELALSRKPDLIMLDMNLPHMNGLEVLAQLRERDHPAPVIFMTVFGSESTAVEAFRLGVRDYLIKPYTADEAQDAVERSLRETRLARQNTQLSRDLVATETVHQTVVTLAHYVNSHLTVLNSGLPLVQDKLRSLAADPLLATILQDCEASSLHITAVMSVLQRITHIRPLKYHSETRMIDIEAALREELSRHGVLR